MVIDLTASEKSTFIRFLSLYLGSSFLLMLMVAFFYFQNEKTLYYDLTKSNMQNVVSQISSKIIFAHMTNKEFDKNYLLKNIICIILCILRQYALFFEKFFNGFV